MRRARHRGAAALLAAILVATSGRAVAAPPVEEPAASDPATTEAQPDAAPPGDAMPTDEDEEDTSAVTSEASAPEDTAPEPEPEPELEPQPVLVLQGTRVKLLGGPRGELELFRLDPRAGDEAVGTIGGIPYTRVCVDPCPERVELEATDELFVAGPNTMPSRTFTLDEEPYELELHVRPGPRSIRFAGFGLTVSGAILVPGGGLLVGAFQNRNLDIAGFTLIGVGVVALAAGIGLLIRGRTLVQPRVRRR